MSKTKLKKLIKEISSEYPESGYNFLVGKDYVESLYDYLKERDVSLEELIWLIGSSRVCAARCGRKTLKEYDLKKVLEKEGGLIEFIQEYHPEFYQKYAPH